MSDKNKKYPLYSPSLEDKSFFDWPMHETLLPKNKDTHSKSTRPTIIRPKVNISEKIILDRIKKINIQTLLDIIQHRYALDVNLKRKISRGGEYYKWMGAGYQLTKEMIVAVVQEVFEEYRVKEQLKKEKELSEDKPEVVVLNASQLLHSE